MTQVVFRAHASAEIGTGHVARCRALADELEARGAKCRFGEIRLPERPRWLVIDDYGTSAAGEAALRASVDAIMVIDDLADRAHDCDILLNQNAGAEASRYAGRVPGRCRLLLGPRYALLRREFRGAHRPRDGSVRRVLVQFGGADPGNHTARAVNALRRMPLQVTVIAGAANPNVAALERACADVPGWRFLAHSDRMAEEMAAADVAIGAGGVSALERCAVGLPAVAWSIADNQRPGLDALAARGALINPPADVLRDEAALAAELGRIFADAERLRAVSERALSVCDGLGAARVAALLLMRVRRATAEDCDRILEWRNHPDVRRQSRDPRAIGAQEHRRWFAAVMADPARALLIAEDASGPVGVVRYDMNGTSAEVSIYLRPGAGGQGLGSGALSAGERWLREAYPGVRELRATVVPGNEASARLFAGDGYRGYRKELKP